MEIKKFRGLKNTTSAERFGAAGFLDVASNVDVDDTGRVLARSGATSRLAGDYHSLWADGDMALLMSGSDLYRLNQDYSKTFLTRLRAPRPVSYVRPQNTVYYSNGVDTGRVHEGSPLSWGVCPPRGQPVAAPSGGTLPPGRYQYALTFLRADGFESGTGVAGLVELTGTGGIAFSSIEVSPSSEVVDKCLYLSGPNGEELFRMVVLPAAATSHTYLGSGYDLSVPLDTQFENQPPAGDIVETYNGVMYVVQGNVAFHSLPYQYERFCARDRFLQFPGQVTMFAPVSDGIYVSAGDVTYFLAGKAPGAFESRVVFDYGAIAGTSAKTTMGALKLEEEAPEGDQSEAAVMWLTPTGVCLGGPGGLAINMTERDYSFPSAERGAAIVRQARGYTQYLSALRGAQDPASNAFQ